MLERCTLQALQASFVWPLYFPFYLMYIISAGLPGAPWLHNLAHRRGLLCGFTVHKSWNNITLD